MKLSPEERAKIIADPIMEGISPTLDDDAIFQVYKVRQTAIEISRRFADYTDFSSFQDLMIGLDHSVLKVQMTIGLLTTTYYGKDTLDLKVRLSLI